MSDIVSSAANGILQRHHTSAVVIEHPDQVRNFA